MRSKLYISIGLIAYFLIVGWFCYKNVKPTDEEINSNLTSAVQPVSDSVFQDPVIKKINNYSQFGKLPVTLDKNFQGKGNPFAK